MKTKTAYDLTKLGLDVLLAIEHSVGDINNTVELLLGEWDMEAQDRGAKLDGMRYVTKQLEAQADFLKKEAQGLAARRKALEKHIQQIKDRATELLLVTERIDGSGTIKSDSHSFWIVYSRKVVGPENVDDWPELVRRVRMEPDRQAAKKILELGGELDGISLVDSPSIRWR